MIKLYHKTSIEISKLVTKRYSTSFSIAVSFLDPKIRNAIYAIYGFVRLADEIVDSFDGYDREKLINQLEADYKMACKDGISINPVLHSFQFAVKKYNIPDELIDAFLKSMKADLTKKDYSKTEEINEYIYGSADVVGLMCLKVFTYDEPERYDELKESAMKLGSAFQKVNFLRDLKDDIFVLDRRYFPNVDADNFDEETKMAIVGDIEADFEAAQPGVDELPYKAKLAVLIALFYYQKLLENIVKTPANRLLKKRVRVNSAVKMALIAKAWYYYINK